MKRWLEITRIVVFAGLICGPVLALLAFGPVAEYGFRFTGTPDVNALLDDAPEARKTLGDFVLDRSVVKREAISLHNRFLYSVLGYMDTPFAVSGRDGWLFFKPELFNGECLSEAVAAHSLAHIDAMVDVAAAAGMRLVIAVAPDKSIVYPEELHPRARAYWKCRAESGAAWRQRAASRSPAVVDLAPPILAAKHDYPALMYFRTDTHWTRLGAALAIRRLIGFFADPGTDWPEPRLAEHALARKTDLDVRMLLDLPPESAPELDAEIESAVAEMAGKLDRGKIVVLHDSFVNIWLDDFKASFDGQYLNVNDGPSSGTVTAAMAEADTAIVVIVERNLFRSPEWDILAWQSSVGTGILARNRRAAESCSMDPDEVDVSRKAAKRAGGNPRPAETTAPATRTVAVPLTPGRLPCVALSLKSKTPVVVDLFLPERPGAPASEAFFAGGRIAVAMPAGEGELRLVLPPYVAGKDIRVGLASGEPLRKIKSIRLGTHPP